VCSIIAVRGAWADTKLLICANRDEQLTRPSEGLLERVIGHRNVICPLDLVAGGTWLGTNDCGLFVGITNRFAGPPDSHRKSRGELVTNALATATVDEALDATLQLPARHFNPCHLIFASSERLSILVNDGVRWTHHSIDTPAAVITERSFNAAPTTRDSLLRKTVDSWLAQNVSPNNAEIARLMSTHATPTFEGVCVHWNERSYGTRMLTIIRSNSAGDLSHYSTAGAPCESKLVQFEHRI
jgi:uncharacterized protein with NRDE domain